jgi:hypothetical protein
LLALGACDISNINWMSTNTWVFIELILKVSG